MQTEKCAKVTRAVALGQILIRYFHTLNTDERFSVNHICEQHMRIIIYLRNLVSPLLFAVERPLPFINCFWSVLVLTDPDQLGVTGFV